MAPGRIDLSLVSFLMGGLSNLSVLELSLRKKSYIAIIDTSDSDCIIIMNGPLALMRPDSVFSEIYV